MRELGYEVVFQDWSGLLAPGRTQRDIVARANAAINEVIRSPAGAAAMVNIGAEADLNSPEQFAALYRGTWERYRDVVKSNGFTAED